MAELIRVVAAVIHQNGKLLICQRPPHKRHGGLWEFPGGKLHPGESTLQAADRELTEELGVRVTAVGECELALHDPGSEFLIEFVHVTIQGHPVALEHQALAWVGPENLLSYHLAPSDARFAQHWLQVQGLARD